jgi:hypothetical protein
VHRAALLSCTFSCTPRTCAQTAALFSTPAPHQHARDTRKDTCVVWQWLCVQVACRCCLPGGRSVCHACDCPLPLCRLVARHARAHDGGGQPNQATGHAPHTRLAATAQAHHQQQHLLNTCIRAAACSAAARSTHPRARITPYTPADKHHGHARTHAHDSAAECARRQLSSVRPALRGDARCGALCCAAVTRRCVWAVRGPAELPRLPPLRSSIHARLLRARGCVRAGRQPSCLTGPSCPGALRGCPSRS